MSVWRTDIKYKYKHLKSEIHYGDFTRMRRYWDNITPSPLPPPPPYPPAMAAGWHALLVSLFIVHICVFQTILGADSFVPGSFGITADVSCPTGSEPVGGECGKYQVEKPSHIAVVDM